jgi:hypothetical protein
MADFQDQFSALLETLASPDNEARNRGEEQYNAIPIDQRLNLLLGSIETSSSTTLRFAAVVLVYRYSLFKGVYFIHNFTLVPHLFHTSDLTAMNCC